MTQQAVFAEWLRRAAARIAAGLATLERFPLLVPLLIVLLAFGLRVHALERQSLWNDEGNSLRLAQRAVSDLIDAAGRDIHPPGYYLALKAWIALAGQTEFGLRAFSVLAGALTVALAIALGRALGGRGAGSVAGLLVALSPFAVYYSQEARMYALLGLLSAASTLVLVKIKSRFTTESTENTEKNKRKADLQVQAKPVSVSAQDRLRSGAAEQRPYTSRIILKGFSAFSVFSVVNRLFALALALALLTAAGLYAQYSYGFTLLAQAIVVLVWAARLSGAARLRLLGAYSAINALALLLFLPWLPTAYEQISTWPRTGVDLALSAQLRTALGWIVYGNTAGAVGWLRFLWPGLLIGAALIGERRRALLPLIWAAVVIAALFGSGAYREANLKMLLPAQIAVAVLCGQGAAAWWAQDRPLGRLTRREWRATAQMLAVMSVFLVAIGQANALHALYNDPAYARDDYRGMARAIRAEARPGDAVILDAPNQAEVFTYYYDGPAPIYPLPQGLGGDDEQTRADVLGVIAAHQRIFVLFWGEPERDPNRVVQATLDSAAYPIDSRWYGDVRLARYAVLPAAPEDPAVRSGALFGEHIALAGYALSAEALRPGDVLGVTLYWQTAAPLDVRYKVTVQLLGTDGRLIAQHDGEPGGDRALTTTWAPGVTVRDTHGIVVPTDLPTAGEYTLSVGLYDLNAPAARLPVRAEGAAAGDLLALATLRVK